jgi:hypothetical protein
MCVASLGSSMRLVKLLGAQLATSHPLVQVEMHLILNYYISDPCVALLLASDPCVALNSELLYLVHL